LSERLFNRHVAADNGRRPEAGRFLTCLVSQGGARIERAETVMRQPVKFVDFLPKQFLKSVAAGSLHALSNSDDISRRTGFNALSAEVLQPRCSLLSYSSDSFTAIKLFRKSALAACPVPTLSDRSQRSFEIRIDELLET